MQETSKYVTHVTAKRSDLTRAYYETVDWRVPLPSISDIMNNPDDYIGLMYHIAMNHKGLNWLIYKSQLNFDTYPIFIYSLAFCAMNENPTISYSWQMNKNARRVGKFIKENHIFLLPDETKLLAICSYFPSWTSTKAQRASEIGSIIEALHKNYGDAQLI